MNHLGYINYFKGKAISHYQLRHGAALPDSPKGTRVAFFRMSNNLEVHQETSVQVNYPYLALPIYNGRLSDNDGLIEDVMTGYFEIRSKVDNPIAFDQVEEARELCKQIGLEIIASMIEEMEELGSCGPIGDFDPNSVKYDFTGPLNNSEYGCLFFFEFRDTAMNVATMDLSNVFI